MPAPITATATRTGARVIVTRADDVVNGASPLVSIMTDELDVLSFEPATALALAGMLARAATTTVELTIKVTNSYAVSNEVFTHKLIVDAPAPLDGVALDDWAIDNLIQHTGEGPAYAQISGLYEVEILAAPAPFEHLINLAVAAQG